MWAVDGQCGQLTIDVGGSGHDDHGDGQWWPGVVVDGGLRKREEVCVFVRLRGVFVFGYKLYFRSSRSSNFGNCETEDQTAVAVFDGPGNFQSWAVLVQSSLGLFPVLELDFQALPVEHLQKGHFVLFWSFVACFWQNKPFSKDSTDITAQYFLLIFDMLIQVNQKHLLAPFPASTYFFFP